MADAINNNVDIKYRLPPAEEQPTDIEEINRQLQDEYMSGLELQQGSSEDVDTNQN